MELVIARTGGTVARTVEIAATRATRRQGLLGRESLDPSTALVLSPCFAVHSAFMRFAIDVVFVDREGTIRRIAELPPWRIAADFGASAVVELAAGVARARGLRVGDRLCLSDGSDPGRVFTSSFARASLRRAAAVAATARS